MKGLRNRHNTVIRRTRNPEHPCGSIMAGVRGCPQGVAPITHHPAMRDNQQHLQSTRRNALPMKCINRSLLVCHEYLTRALV
jgi:hypothetical protein